MSVKKDESGRRWVEVEVEVPGTPEEVWAAIATGPGVSSWFVPTEQRDDGTIVSHFGPGMDAVATLTAWDPPRRFEAEGEFAPNTKIGTEWIVEARAGGTCMVRVVHSLFVSTDDWDDQLERIEAGWPDYFHILRLHLTHFRGRPSAMFQLLAFAPEPASAVWEQFTAALGLAGAVVGDRRKAPAEAPRLAGVVEREGSPGHPHACLLRLDEPTTGAAHFFALAMGGQVCLSLRFYLYGEAASACTASEEPAWQAWLNGRFPTAADSNLVGGCEGGSCEDPVTPTKGGPHGD